MKATWSRGSVLLPVVFAAILMVSVAQAAVLPLGFTLDKVSEAYKPWRKTGLMVAWEVQRYRGGIPDGEPQAGTLSLSQGRYRAESGDEALKQVRVFDNAKGGILSGGRYAPLPEGAQPALPEGLYLRSSGSLEDLMSSIGVDRQFASPGRMPTGSEEIPFKPVIRYGVPAGADDGSLPQVWIEPHRWLIHRVVFQEGEGMVQVDYLGHGLVANDIPWLPREIRVSQGGRMLYSAVLTSALGTRPSDSLFDLSALAQSGSP